MPPRRSGKNPAVAAQTARFKNLTVDTDLNEWVHFPTAAEIYGGKPTEIQRRQHRIKAHKYKIKHLESERKSYLDRQKNSMKKVAKHGRGDPATLYAAADKLRVKELNLITEWERIHGRGLEINWSKPKDALEKRIAAAHRKYRQAMDKVTAAKYKPGNKYHDADVRGLARINRAIAKEKAAMAANAAKLNRARAPAARAPAARATGNANTGKKDAKGRTIFKGPRGGLFVRVNGKKQKPALGRRTD